ncbi:phage head-tail connector protein [Streptomyces sp. NPDC057686]|uniref:phage head-tail connector protein n=1 Tax=Streptomyces sp. NPDC057686 TaxID=3346212 RepID=UPI0036BF5971
MALGDNYATLAELKTRLGIDDTNDDTTLTQALAAASRSIEKSCRRQFNKAGALTARFFVPVTGFYVAVNDIWTMAGLIVKTDEDDDGVFETTWTIVTDYELRPLDGVRDGVPGWPYWQIIAVGVRDFPFSRRATVQVTADWGWNAVPAPVKEACLILAEEIWKVKDAPFGVAGFGEFGSIRVRANPKVAALLADYRLKAVRVR